MLPNVMFVFSFFKNIYYWPVGMWGTRAFYELSTYPQVLPKNFCIANDNRQAK